MNREANLKALADGGPFDALVIGGGIIGAGCARDLATRGLRVALVEGKDFGHGTTARSTRLIHGGLRYLEQRDFGLVRESLRERELLLRNAPHLVQPLLFVTPLYSGGRHSRPVLKVGMALYDLLSYDKTLPGHRTYDADGILRLLPNLNPSGLTGGATYYDGQVELPERLCWENILSAHQHGGAVANHARVVRLLREEEWVVGAEVRDERSGATFPVRASLTVNTTGPWVDESLRELLGIPRDRRFLRRTKGVHLVVPKFTEHAAVLIASDGRVFFVVPWRGFSVVGTTDTDFQGDPADVAADAKDVAYLQESTRRSFPGADVDTIYYTWAGVRALVLERSRTGMTESQVSRKDKIHDHAQDGVPGLVTVLGGKITAYRAISEQLGALAVRLLGRGGPSRTAEEPYPGKLSYFTERDAADAATQVGLPADEFVREFRQKREYAPLSHQEKLNWFARTLANAKHVIMPGWIEAEIRAGRINREEWVRNQIVPIGEEEARALILTYGGMSKDVLEAATKDPAQIPLLARRVVPDAPEILAQVAYAAREEMAVTLGDALLRRTGIGFGPHQGLDGLEDAARIMGAVHGWDEAQTAAEMEAYRREIEPMRRFATVALPRLLP